MSKVIIAGGRDFVNWKLLLESMSSAIDDGLEITEIVSGKARGADTLGERFARLVDVPIKEFPADWTKFGKRAGFIRNKQMAEYGDVLVVFWDGVSSGTSNMITQAKSLNLKIIVVQY